MQTKAIVALAALVFSAGTSVAAPPKMTDTIARELDLYVGRTIELASAGRPYQEVIQHIGKPPPQHLKALANGEGAASLYPASDLFSEITFHLGKGDKAQQIVSMEFISKKDAYDMNDLRAAFGEWHRSPKEPEQVTYAVAWFPKFDASTGAHMFLYAEDGNYATSIDPAQTPKRLFVQSTPFRWGD